eukprot:7247974-Alexandrium_andersonii.AAC.1
MVLCAMPVRTCGVRLRMRMSGLPAQALIVATHACVCAHVLPAAPALSLTAVTDSECSQHSHQHACMHMLALPAHAYDLAS